MNLADTRKKRELFLLTVYDMAEGEANRDVPTKQLAERVGIDNDEETSKLGRYWREEGMVDWGSFDRIFLTPKGRTKAEELIEVSDVLVTAGRTIDTEMKKCPGCSSDIRLAARFCDNCGLAVHKFESTTLVESSSAAITLPMGDSLIGKVLDSKYEIIGRLGAGGGGTVYRARRVHMGGDEVAVKVLLDRHLADPSFRERLQQEARAAANLHHQNIVTIHDFSPGNGDADSPAYIVMELVNGVSLAALLKSEGQFQASRSVELMRQICAAVGVAHSAGIFHRDLKPANIIILPATSESTAETVKIIDFGIAKFHTAQPGNVITEAGILLGTPQYMSPEQCRGESVDARSDVYSLGVMLYEMLAGTPPFTASSNAEIISKHLNDSPPNLPLHLGISSELEAVLLRALAKGVGERQADATAFSRELRNALEWPQISAVPSTPVETIIDLGQGLTNIDNLIFKLACEKAIEKGDTYLLDVEQVIAKASDVKIPRNKTIESLEMLSEQFFIKPHTVMGGGLPFPWFDITHSGFEQYAGAYIGAYAKITTSVILQIVDSGKRDNRSIVGALNQPQIIVDHILNRLMNSGLIEASEYNGRLISISDVSTRLKRMARDSQL